MFKSKFWNRIKSKSAIIYQSPFLSRMSQLERYEFLQHCHRRRYKSGENVYHQGDPGTGFYLIEQGSVELQYLRATDNELVSLSELHSPECFGAFSVDYRIRRKATARCLTDCILYGFFISDYQTLGKRHPHIARRFLETLNVVSMQQFELALSRLTHGENEPETFALLHETYDMNGGDLLDEKIR